MGGIGWSAAIAHTFASQGMRLGRRPTSDRSAICCKRRWVAPHLGLGREWLAPCQVARRCL